MQPIESAVLAEIPTVCGLNGCRLLIAEFVQTFEIETEIKVLTKPNKKKREVLDLLWRGLAVLKLWGLWIVRLDCRYIGTDDRINLVIQPSLVFLSHSIVIRYSYTQCL